MNVSLSNKIAYILQEEGHTYQGDGVFGKKESYEARRLELESMLEYEIDNLFEFYGELASDKIKFNQLKADVYQDILSRQKDSATERICSYIKKHHHIKTTMTDHGEEIWFYKDGIYEPNGSTLIQATARRILEKGYTTNFKNEILNKIKADTFIKPEEFFDQQNNNPYLLPVQNGILNLITGQLKPFTPKKYYFNKINAKYVPGAEPPFFLEFLNQVLGTSELHDTIQEWFGFCLTRTYKYEKSMMWYGAKGRNGKSKLLEVLQILLGPGNYSNVSLKSIENKNDKFVLGNLRNKFVNIAADISPEALSNEGNFKGLTGGDSFTVDQKFKNSITFKNYAKMMFSANELPVPGDTSDAFWARWILIEFPNRFLPQKEIDDLPEEQQKNVFLQKTDLMKDLTTPDELSGLLNWCMEGLQRLELNGDFTYKDTLAKVKKKWNMRSNNLIAFNDEYIKTDYDAFITKREYKHLYATWCRHEGLKPVSDKVIYKTLSDMGVTTERISVDAEMQRVWNGIKLKSDVVPGREKLR